MTQRPAGGNGLVHNCSTKAAIFDFRFAQGLNRIKGLGEGRKGKQVRPWPPFQSNALLKNGTEEGPIFVGRSRLALRIC
jgi:hypothetical protein